MKSGTRLGVYEIVAPIGEGGMGQVYRGRDTKLDRDVAIKLLPDAFAADADRLARFQREARTLASLNHPHIAAIYDLEDSGGTTALVMELVEGEDLAQRLARGPIPLEEALPIAQQIADALEAAHEQGIIHRDLKPANIKLRRDGTVKVLDFGLAKVAEASGSEFRATLVASSPFDSRSGQTVVGARSGLAPFDSPVGQTVVDAHSEKAPFDARSGQTEVGTIVGTAAYMAPEQARGRAVDKRVDIWAFGCVLYEMLAGRPVFSGESVTDILARVLEREPPLDATNAVPARLLAVCRRCLDKDVRRRYRDIGDVRVELEDMMAGKASAPEAQRPPAKSPPARARRLMPRAFVAATLLAVVSGAAFAAAMYFQSTRAESAETRLDVTTPATGDPVSLAISPDGRAIVFVAAAEGKSRLWLRSLTSTDSHPIVGTDGASYPFWAPDGRNLGFFAQGKLKRADLDGGTVSELAAAPAGRGGTWNKDGVILFAPSGEDRIYRTSASGGPVQPVTPPDDAARNNHRMPQFLPDGHHFLFFAQGTSEGRGEYVGSLDAPDVHRVLDDEAAAVFVAPDFLAFERQGALLAQRFDLAKNALAGNPFPVAPQVAFDSVLGIEAVTAAPGVIAYRAGAAVNAGRLTWFDRQGRPLGTVGDADVQAFNPELSPDGSRLAVNLNGNSPDVWLMEMGRDGATRLTHDGSSNLAPVWSPDGGRIAFGSNHKGVYDLYQESAGGGPEESLLESPQIKWPESWSRDGYILYREQSAKTGLDLLALARDGYKPIPIATTEFDEREGQFSPDGRFVAYQSNESGHFEIYVQAFPEPTAKWRVSTNGGAQPRWGSEGRELFYVSLDGNLMAVPIAASPDGRTVDVGAAAVLFPSRLVLGPVPAIQRQQYAVSPDGQRFLLNVTTDQANNPITMILNWHPPKS